MTPAERFAYFLEHGVTDIDFLAKVLDTTPERLTRAIAYIAATREVTNIADEGMRLDAAIREIDSREWKALSFDQQLDRAAFLFRTFHA
mgnify:FL=1